MRDLTLVLYDDTAKKVIKSIPQKGTDPELAAVAAADLADMKKNMKKVIKDRNDQLFHEFLHERPRPAASWRGSYMVNPLLRTVAQLIVWKQDNTTFLLDAEGKPMLSTGEAYRITDEAISVAHPMEMDIEDISRWQEYFRSHGLKQPFEQIWEPGYDLSQISAERYTDYRISVFRFLHAEKHGITSIYNRRMPDYWESGMSYVSEVSHQLEDCALDLWGAPDTVEEFEKDSTYKLGRFQIMKSTRAANHIVYLLDKWTLQERIRKDDASVVNMVETMTAAQVMELLNLAIENSSPNCTAALLELKNRKFPNYTQEMEFLL